MTGQPITIETLETALDRLAVIMAEAPDEGIAYLPIWRRVEIELAALQSQDKAMAGVHARLARLSGKNKNAPEGASYRQQ